MSADDEDSPARPSGERLPRCPNCGKQKSERYDPFCSKRCADVDLHRWLKGRYAIPGTAPGGDEQTDD